MAELTVHQANFSPNQPITPDMVMGGVVFNLACRFFDTINVEFFAPAGAKANISLHADYSWEGHNHNPLYPSALGTVDRASFLVPQDHTIDKPLIVRYQAMEVSTTAVVEAVVDSNPNVKQAYRIIIGLSELERLSNSAPVVYWENAPFFVGASYGVRALNERIEMLSEAFDSQFNKPIRIGLMSLIKGGLLDPSGRWTPPCAGHVDGRSVDILCGDLTEEESAALLDLARELGLKQGTTSGAREGSPVHFTIGPESPQENDASSYETRVAELLARLKELGVDTAPLERFYAALIVRVGQLQAPETLPDGFRGLLQSLGLVDPLAHDEAELRRWRGQVLAKTRSFWLRLLASEDPEKIKKGLEQWMHALEQFDSGVREQAEASLHIIVAWQKSVEECAGGVPVLGSALDLLAAARGESLSGEEIGPFRRFMTIAGTFGPAVLEKILKRYGRAGPQALEEIGDLGEQLASKEGRKEVARLAGVSEETVAKTAETLTHLPPVKKGVEVENLLKRYVKQDLNDLKPNFPIVDAVSRENMYVSIADSGRSDRYLMRKFQALLGFGSGASVTKYRAMLSELGKYEHFPPGTSLDPEDFLKKAWLCVPDDHYLQLRERIAEKIRNLGTWPSEETFAFFLRLKGGNREETIKYICEMVQPHSRLRK